MTPEQEIKDLKRALAAKDSELESIKAKSLAKLVKTSDEMEGYSGKYKEISTGAIFALRVVEPHEVRVNKTHFAKNATHFGDYTPQDFRRLFEKL